MRKYVLFIILICLLGMPSWASAFPAKKVYKKTSGSVVLIVSRSESSGSLVGAGSIVSRSGLVVTNAHVVIDKKTGEPYEQVRVFIKPNTVSGDLRKDLVNKYKARVMTYDVDLDLALVKVKDFYSDTDLIELADPGEIMVGEEVVAIGHPEQGGLWSLTYGRISGQIADQSKIKGKNVFQTDTSVNRGNSGGPLLDKRGYMVGVNTNIARLGEGNLPITGVNFAVKSSVVKRWMKDGGYAIDYGKEPLEGPAMPEPAPVSVEPEKAEPEPKEAAPVKIEPEPVREKPVEVKPVLPKEIPVKVKPVDVKPKVVDEEDPFERMTKAEKGKIESDTILTPKRPITHDDLFTEVEKELEDLMEEMRMKIRR
jgi:serine protease Do